MGNTLSGLIPTIYQAADQVSRELTGLIPAVFRDSGADQVAVNQTITYPVVPVSTASDIAPATTPPDDGDQTIGNDTMTINKSRMVPIRWTGEEIKSVSGLHANLLQNQFAQAMRTLCNEVEADLAALYAYASRAYGTAGTTPFGTAGDFSDASFVRKILVDNGAPLGDMQLIIDTTAGATMRGKQSQAQMAGTTNILRQGVLLDVHGLAIRESAQIKSHTKGTGASYLTNNVSGYAVGDSTIALDTGSGTVLAGDVVTFAGDTNKYLVGTALSGGSMAINAPGLRKTLADGVAATVGNSYTANMCFDRNAIHLLTRTPAMPPGGDAADDVTTITDPRSGLVFQVALYRQYRRVRYEVGLAWGVKAVKRAHMALLLG